MEVFSIIGAERMQKNILADAVIVIQVVIFFYIYAFIYIRILWFS